MTDSNPAKMLFDAHCHIIAPGFPLVENQGYLPPIFDIETYRAEVHTLHPSYLLAGGAVVSGSFQAFDQTYLVAALKQLGDGFVGVTQLASTVSDDEIVVLNEQGVRAIRFNLKRGGSETVTHIETMAKRVWELCGWHVELYVDSADLTELAPILLRLPKCSVDHLGLSQAGQSLLLRLAEANVRIKATGFGRLDFDPLPFMQTLYQINPSALMFGTDLPSTRAPRPYQSSDLMLVESHFGSEASRQILFQNAADFYGVSAPGLSK